MFMVQAFNFFPQSRLFTPDSTYAPPPKSPTSYSHSKPEYYTNPYNTPLLYSSIQVNQPKDRSEYVYEKVK